MIGLKNLRHLPNQLDAQPKPIVTWLHAFSRAWLWLLVFALSSHWFILFFTFVVIGCDWFGFTMLNSWFATDVIAAMLDDH